MAEPVAGVPPVLAQGQGGLLDVVPHPAFATNRLLYLSFSKPGANGSAVTTAVVPDRSQFPEQRLLFAHAGRRTISSRTRGFVQHVV